MHAADTNVLLYAHDSRDPAKQAVALALLPTLTNGALLWQVACEYLSASRKLASLGYNGAQAWSDLQTFRQVWTTILPGWDVLDEAQQLLGRYRPLVLGRHDHSRLPQRWCHSALFGRL